MPAQAAFPARRCKVSVCQPPHLLLKGLLPSISTHPSAPHEQSLLHEGLAFMLKIRIISFSYKWKRANLSLQGVFPPGPRSTKKRGLPVQMHSPDCAVMQAGCSGVVWEAEKRSGRC